MHLAAIPAGRSIFVDANICVYAFSADPVFGPPCIELLERIEQGDLQGSMSAAVLGEVAHRLMTLEACQTWNWPYRGIANRLRQHPAEVRKLQRFRTALSEIVATGAQIVAVSGSHVLRAGDLSQQHGLLSNDALIIAVMESEGLTSLASNDADFDCVPGIVRYSPV